MTGLAQRQRDAVKKKEHRAERLNAKALQTDNYQKIQELYRANADAAWAVRKHSGIKKYIEPNVAVKNMLAAGDAQKQYERGRKSTSRYLKRMSKKYTVKYDVSTGQYSLHEK